MTKTRTPPKIVNQLGEAHNALANMAYEVLLLKKANDQFFKLTVGVSSYQLV